MIATSSDDTCMSMNGSLTVKDLPLTPDPYDDHGAPVSYVRWSSPQTTVSFGGVALLLLPVITNRFAFVSASVEIPDKAAALFPVSCVDPVAETLCVVEFIFVIYPVMTHIRPEAVACVVTPTLLPLVPVPAVAPQRAVMVFVSVLAVFVPAAHHLILSFTLASVPAGTV